MGRMTKPNPPTQTESNPNEDEMRLRQKPTPESLFNSESMRRLLGMEPPQRPIQPPQQLPEWTPPYLKPPMRGPVADGGSIRPPQRPGAGNRYGEIQQPPGFSQPSFPSRVRKDFYRDRRFRPTFEDGGFTDEEILAQQEENELAKQYLDDQINSGGIIDNSGPIEPGIVESGKMSQEAFDKMKGNPPEQKKDAKIDLGRFTPYKFSNNQSPEMPSIGQGVSKSKIDLDPRKQAIMNILKGGA